MADLTPLQRLDQAIHQLDKRTPPPLELIAAMVSALSEAMAEREHLLAVLPAEEEERGAFMELIKARYSGLTLPAGYNVLDFLILWHTQEKTARQKAEAEVAALRADKERLDRFEATPSNLLVYSWDDGTHGFLWRSSSLVPWPRPSEAPWQDLRTALDYPYDAARAAGEG